MKLETFFEKFELFADAPNAVAKMREWILSLAVRGKLVAPDERDEPALSLLKYAAVEKQQLVAARKIRLRPEAPVAADEQPYELPASWAWARLSDVGYELGQKVPDKRFTYIDVGSIDSGKGHISDRVERLDPNEAPSRARKLVARGTVIYSTVRPYLLNIAIVEQDFDAEPIASTAFGILHPFAGICNRYLFYWLRSAPFTAYVQACMKGMAYPAINDEKFYSGFIALPPLAEQKRIVVKVDELMALCDQLETQQQEREAKKADLARASLARFAEAPTPANLEFIFHKSYDITPADLRRSVLLLGFEGKLVPQSEVEGTGSELLLQISQSHPDGRSFGSKRKGQSALDPFSCLGAFDVPSSWSWTYLDFLCEQIADVDHNMPKAVSEGVPFISAKDLKDDGTIDFSAPKLISEDDFQRLSRKVNIRRDDIIYSRIGARLGKARLVNVDTRFLISYSCCLVRPMHGFVDKRYLQLFLDSTLALSQAHKGAQSIGVPDLGLGEIKAFQVPIPPLAEQRRIVARVDQLMALVDQLEVQLTESKAYATRLLDALVAELAA